MYKVCVHAMTTRDLSAWVHSLPVTYCVKAITVHVGVKDCPAGHISQDSWRELVTLLTVTNSLQLSFQTQHCHLAPSSRPEGDII